MAPALRTPAVGPVPPDADAGSPADAARDRALLFRSLVREVADVPLRVRGRIPPWLAGTLVRNGPALFELRAQRLRHWFDGLAMLHAFAIADGRVRYTNRFVRGRAFRAARRAGRLRYREFATDPCHALFARVKALFVPGGPGGVTDNANIAVARLGAHHAALTEGALPIAFDPRTLRTLGVVDWRGRAPAAPQGSALVTAHPHVGADVPLGADPGRNGAVVNLRLRFGARCRHELFAVVDGVPRVLATHATREPSYVHSFGLTPTTAVLVETPWTVRPTALLRDGLAGRSFAESFRWRTGRPTRFVLLDATGAGRQTVACEAPPLFTFHHVNAFDDGDAVVCDLVAYPDASVVDALYLDALRDPARRVVGGRLQRWRLPRAGGRAELVAEYAPSLELPRIAGARDGRAYRYAYGCGGAEDGHFLDRLVKLDLATGESRTWRAARCYPGEPVFVPRPGGRREDDGVLLTLALDAVRGRSVLVVLDAATLEERARAVAPHAVPAGFHGEFWGDVPATHDDGAPPTG